MRKVRKRFLQDRSFLIFEFKNEGSVRQFSILPFFENISILEDQKANLAVYDLVGRAGNMYAYTGAKSRQFKLNFRMNIMHINDILNQEGLTYTDFSDKIVNLENKKNIRELFLKPPALKDIKSPSTEKSFFKSRAQSAQADYFKLNGYNPNDLSTRVPIGGIPNSDPFGLLRENIQDAQGLLGLGDLAPLVANGIRTKAINLTLWWINLVRSSVLNNANNTIYGPPIIRINHGLLYNNVPCVCNSFSIKETPNTTYDVLTATPHMFDISMALEEVRNSFGDYDPRKVDTADNVAGWDSLHKYKTMDPHTGPGRFF
jgi:hypothetical protein